MGCILSLFRSFSLLYAGGGLAAGWIWRFVFEIGLPWFGRDWRGGLLLDGWGGVRGIRGDIPLIDGGYITRPEFADYNLKSQWVVENHGVAPDIEVDNRPDDVVRGKDAQLDRAIEEVMKQITTNPKKLPARPPDLPAYPEGPAM